MMAEKAGPTEADQSPGLRVLLVGMLVDIFLVVVKIGAGILGHSQALIADGVHTISDLFTDVIALAGLKAGRKAADHDHPFGHARIDTAASAVVGMILLAAAVYLGIDSVWGIYQHVDYHPGWMALVAAGLSIILKEGLYRYTVRVGRRMSSPVVMANAWHHRSDALSSVAVLIGVGGAIVNPEWHILDVYAALLVSFFIVKVGLQILRNSVRELTDTAPEPEVIEKMRRCALCADGALGLHDLKVRTSGGLYHLEAHVEVDGRMTVAEGHRIAKAVESVLKEEIEGLVEVIIHIDPDDQGEEQEWKEQ
ncbi:cation diffusion facilitator family transporter [Thermodesulfobacteriota bacterium]